MKAASQQPRAQIRRHPERAPTPHPTHSFDAGAAWGYLALQAQKLGWAAHGMAGFDHAAAYAATGLPESDFQIDLDGLRGDFLVAVKPDPGLQAELADEDGVQGGAFLGLNSCREF